MSKGQITQDKILGLLRASQTPLTAYDILGEMKSENAKLAPPTVYRALSALTEQGRAHRIESANAYMACQCDDHEGTALLSICDDCGTVDESVDDAVLDQLNKAAAVTGFQPKRHVIEMHGACANCRDEVAE